MMMTDATADHNEVGEEKDRQTEYQADRQTDRLDCLWRDALTATCTPFALRLTFPRLATRIKQTF